MENCFLVETKLFKNKNYTFEHMEITDSQVVFNLLSPLLIHADKETLYILMIDSRRYLMGVSCVALGTINQVSFHPREIFKSAILSNATAIVLCHNHPIGPVTPSPSDIEATKTIVQAGSIIGIDVLDHIIINDSTYFSFQDSTIEL